MERASSIISLILSNLIGVVCAFTPPILYELIRRGGWLSLNQTFSFVDLVLLGLGTLIYYKWVRNIRLPAITAPKGNPFEVKEFDRDRGILKTGHEDIAFTESTHESWEQTVSPIDAALSANLSALKSQAVGLIEKYNPKYDGSDWALPIALDVTFANWLLSSDAEKEVPKYVIDSLGAIYGEVFVKLLGCRWVVVEDQQGKSVAVHHAPTNNFVYPFDAVEKRVDKNEIDFFHNIFVFTKAAIEKKHAC